MASLALNWADHFFAQFLPAASTVPLPCARFGTLNESLWRLAMKAENALGLREAVAERYERLRALLDERLGLEPAEETRLLHRRLLAQT